MNINEKALKNLEKIKFWNKISKLSAYKFKTKMSFNCSLLFYNNKHVTLITDYINK